MAPRGEEILFPTTLATYDRNQANRGHFSQQGQKKIHLSAVRRTGGFLISAGTTYSLGGSQYHRREEIYYRVRNGNGCGLSTIGTRKFHREIQTALTGTGDRSKRPAPYPEIKVVKPIG